MHPRPIIDLETIDPGRVVFDKEEIRARNPHRHEMELLDRIVHFDPAEGSIAAIKHVRDDEFWVRGHFPGRPVFPGVLMLEAAGQICSFYCKELLRHERVMGFASAREVRFRGLVVPGDELLIVGRILKLMKNRGARFSAQGYVRQQLVFECEILGMFL